MKDYVKLALVAGIFLLGSAIESAEAGGYKSQGYGATTGRGSHGQAIQRPAFETLTRDAYGLGVSSDQFGRPVKTDVFGNPNDVRQDQNRSRYNRYNQNN